MKFTSEIGMLCFAIAQHLVAQRMRSFVVTQDDTPFPISLVQNHYRLGVGGIEVTFLGTQADQSALHTINRRLRLLLVIFNYF